MDQLQPWQIVLVKALRCAVGEDRRVTAVKAIRQWTGLGLREALEIADTIRDSDVSPCPWHLAIRYLDEQARLQRTTSEIMRWAYAAEAARLQRELDAEEQDHE